MKNLLLWALAGLAIGCTSTATVPQGSDAEMSFDGLVRVRNATFDKVWIDPEIDLSVYDKIMLSNAKFEFRAVRSTGGSNYSSRSTFPISEQSQKRLIYEVTTTFREELGKSEYFTIVDAPGPDVLILEGGLLDIVSRVPPDRAGRGDVYLSRVGDATLVLELMDSMSGETLVRATERRAAERAGSGGLPASNVSTWTEVRRLARRWGTKLRNGLDSVHKTG